LTGIKAAFSVWFMITIDRQEEGITMLEIDVGKITFIITKTREFEAQAPAPAPEGIAGEGIDGRLAGAEFRESGEADTNDATYDELKSWIRAINHDDQCQIVALAWVGRGDFGRDEWDEALKIAHDEHNN
jgi:hypothetical protein